MPDSSAISQARPTSATIRIEVGGDLHQNGGLNGKPLTVAEAEAVIVGAAAA